MVKQTRRLLLPPPVTPQPIRRAVEKECEKCSFSILTLPFQSELIKITTRLIYLSSKIFSIIFGPIEENLRPDLQQSNLDRVGVNDTGVKSCHKTRVTFEIPLSRISDLALNGLCCGARRRTQGVPTACSKCGRTNLPSVSVDGRCRGRSF